jgi:Domain of unknown function (DUF4342)/zinc-ribbon domain
MTVCGECGVELPVGSKFCPNCGVKIGIKRDFYEVPSEGLIGKVKEMMHDVSIKRIVVKDEKGKNLLSIPATWGTAGAAATIALAPWLAALGVIAGLVTRCKVEVERDTDSTSDKADLK